MFSFCVDDGINEIIKYKKMEETIELIVKVRINYPDKSKRQEAIKRAKECAISSSVLGSVGCKSKSAKLYTGELAKQNGA